MSKQRLIVEHVVEEGGGYLMILDSDDVLSPEIVSYVRKDNNRHGYVIRQGYLYYASSCEYEKLDDFDKRCGSSTIRFLEPTDNDIDGFDWIEFFTKTKFTELYERSQETSRPFDIIPFPAAVYIRENGENLSQQVSDFRAGFVKRIFRFFRRRRVKRAGVPTLLIKEFGLKPDAYR